MSIPPKVVKFEIDDLVSCCSGVMVLANLKNKHRMWQVNKILKVPLKIQKAQFDDNLTVYSLFDMN